MAVNNYASLNNYSRSRLNQTKKVQIVPVHKTSRPSYIIASAMAVVNMTNVIKILFYKTSKIKLRRTGVLWSD